MQTKTSNDHVLVLIIVLSFLFAFYAYYSSTDVTLRTQIITAILAILGTVIGYRYGSSRNSAKKDEIIQQMNDEKQSTTETKSE